MVEYRNQNIFREQAAIPKAGSKRGPVRNSSTPFRGERKGPTPQAWEGEVGNGERRIPHLIPPSPPPGAEREMRFPLPPPAGLDDAFRTSDPEQLCYDIRRVRAVAAN
jgi:hypothetical protein